MDVSVDLELLIAVGYIMTNDDMRVTNVDQSAPDTTRTYIGTEQYCHPYSCPTQQSMYSHPQADVKKGLLQTYSLSDADYKRNYFFIEGQNDGD